MEYTNNIIEWYFSGTLANEECKYTVRQYRPQTPATKLHKNKFIIFLYDSRRHTKTNYNQIINKLSRLWNIPNHSQADKPAVLILAIRILLWNIRYLEILHSLPTATLVDTTTSVPLFKDSCCYSGKFIKRLDDTR